MIKYRGVIIFMLKRRMGIGKLCNYSEGAGFMQLLRVVEIFESAFSRPGKIMDVRKYGFGICCLKSLNILLVIEQKYAPNSLEGYLKYT